MPRPTITEGPVWQNGNAVLLAREEAIDGTFLTQAAITSIALTVYDLGLASNPIVLGPIAVDKTAVVFDVLQTGDARWTVDELGFNFLYELSGAAFPSASVYRVAVIFTLIDGSQLPLLFRCPVTAVP